MTLQTKLLPERSRINRNIVECKLQIRKNQIIKRTELIETLWNVNYYEQLLTLPTPNELIETLWNVNVKSL